MKRRTGPEAGSLSAPRILPVIQDMCARVVRLREAIVDGDLYFAEQVAADLEVDFVGEIEKLRGLVAP